MGMKGILWILAVLAVGYVLGIMVPGPGVAVIAKVKG